MTSWQHQTWINKGSNWSAALPIRELADYAKRHGIALLGILGNTEHLNAQPPEDHTPFSETAWPIPLPGPYVCAIDLANDKGLGAAVLREARAGNTPWLKYMNVAGASYSFSDDFRTGWRNPDHHLHISIFSDWCTKSIGAFDPLSGPTQGDDMADMEAWLASSTIVAGIPNRQIFVDLWGAAMADRDTSVAQRDDLDRFKRPNPFHVLRDWISLDAKERPPGGELDYQKLAAALVLELLKPRPAGAPPAG